MSRPEPSCPYCAEPIQAGIEKCPYCGELLTREQPKKSNTTLIVVIVCVAAFGCFCIPMIAAIAIPNLIEARQAGNEAAAVGGLRSIVSANEVYRQMKSGEQPRYAPDLKALGDARLIDSVLASGTKQGYRFQLVNGSEDPGRCWMAVADPVKPKTTGSRYFAVNHQGIIQYRTDRPFDLDEVRCEIKGGKQVGK